MKIIEIQSKLYTASEICIWMYIHYYTNIYTPLCWPIISWTTERPHTHTQTLTHTFDTSSLSDSETVHEYCNNCPVYESHDLSDYARNYVELCSNL